MLNFCAYCGSELPTSARFCPHCGRSLDGEAPTAEAAPPPPPKRERVPRKPRPAPEERRPAVVPAIPAPTAVGEQAEFTDITEGPWIRTTEEIFPVAWLAMLFAVCYVGVYFAIEALDGGNPLPGPGWFS